MASKQVVQIMIEAEENVSKAANKAESSLSKLGKLGSKAMDAITNVSSRVSNAFSNIGSYVERAREKFNSFKNSSDKLGMIRNTISNAANSFGQLVRSGDLAAKTMEKLKSVSDGISSKFTSLKSKITSFGSSVKSSLKSAFSLTGIKEKLSSIGGSIDKIKAKMKQLSAEAKGAGGGLGFLKNAASMTAGMIGYDLVNSIMETTRASLNARSGMQAFAQRLNMSATEVATYQKSLDDLQNTFKKVDMDVVGQQATDMAFRLGLPKESLTQLTETTAIFNDAMIRNGRSSEDAMMAMADAMDGQFVRLKEIGISQEDLMRNGWDGDINNKTGLLDAMNKSLKEQHYDELAKSVDTLDDAWQVLSITMGNLLEGVLVPLTPIIVGVVNGITNAITAIKDAFSGLPDWAQIGIAIAAVAISVGLVVSALGGVGAIIPAITGLFGPLIAVIGGISAPVLAVVAAIGLIVAAVYEVGKAFGWWNDVGSMLDAITAGLQRLWSAFISNPDVQAFIQGVIDGFTWLIDIVGQVGQAVLDFFGISSEGNFDIVRTLIDGIGAAWNAVRPAIMFVIGVWQQLASTIELFRTGQMDLPTFIMNILTILANAYRTIFTTIIGLVVRFASQLVQRGISAATRFVNGIITWLKSLPGRAYSALIAVVSRIVSAGSQWVSNAKTKAGEIVSGVYNKLTGLPGQISSALSGVVDAITSPFKSAYDSVCGVVDNIKSKVEEGMNALGNLGGAAGFEAAGFEAAGFEAAGFETTTSNPTEHHETIDVNYNISLDLNNVPGGMSSTDLINALTNRDVLTALTGNRDFQTLDAKVKARINAKSNRARGA